MNVPAAGPGLFDKLIPRLSQQQRQHDASSDCVAVQLVPMQASMPPNCSDRSTAAASTGHHQVQGFLHGVCFHSFSTSTPKSLDSMEGDSSTGSGSTCSKHTGPGTASLLCDSPSISNDSPPSASPALQHVPAAAAALHCQQQGAEVQSGGRAGSGMNSHQLDICCKPNFTLPPLHCMLGSAAAKPHQALPCDPATAPPHSKAASTILQHNNSNHGSQTAFSTQQPAAARTTCSPLAAAGGPPHGPSSNTDMTTPAAVGAGSAAAAAAGVGSSHEAVQAFLQACATRGSVAALAVLVHNNLLPVLPVPSASAGPSYCALTATLAYMYELACRGGVLGQLDDTTIRTLLWTTESFFSQYRSSCKTAVLDYCFYATGLDSDDPLVADTLSEEIPAMTKLQLQILQASSFRLLLSEEQLQFACSTLTEAGASCSNSSCSDAASIAMIQAKINQQIEGYIELHSMIVSSMHNQQHQQDQDMQQEQQQKRPAAQLFPGEIITGMLVAEVPAASSQQQQQQDTVQRLDSRPNRQHWQASHSPTNATSANLLSKPATKADAAAAAAVRQPAAARTNAAAAANNSSSRANNTMQQQRRQARQQLRQAAAAHSQADAAPKLSKPDTHKRAKDQLLELTNREQEVGHKRHRSTATAAMDVTDAAAGSGAGQQPQEQQLGGVGAFGMGGKRMLASVIRTARSAAHYLGCRPQ